MPRRSTQRDPIRTPGRNFEENRALHGPVHVAKILGTPPDEPKPKSEPVKSKTASHDEVPRPSRPPSPASCTGGSVPVGGTQAEGLRSVQGVAEEVAGGDAAPVAPLDAAAPGPRGTELAEFTPDEQGVGAPPDPEASPARSAMSQTSRIPPAAPRSSAKPAHTPRRQSPGSKLPTPRRKDAHYKEDKVVEDKVRGSSLEIYMAARCPVPPGIGLSVWQSRSASLSSAWAALALRWLATHPPSNSHTGHAPLARRA